MDNSTGTTFFDQPRLDVHFQSPHNIAFRSHREHTQASFSRRLGTMGTSCRDKGDPTDGVVTYPGKGF